MALGRNIDRTERNTEPTEPKIAKIFKRPKNREDGSDLDENLTESIAAMKTIISKTILGRFRPKTSRNLAKASRKLREKFRENLREVFARFSRGFARFLGENGPKNFLK